MWEKRLPWTQSWCFDLKSVYPLQSMPKRNLRIVRWLSSLWNSSLISCKPTCMLMLCNQPTSKWHQYWESQLLLYGWHHVNVQNRSNMCYILLFSRIAEWSWWCTDLCDIGGRSATSGQPVKSDNCLSEYIRLQCSSYTIFSSGREWDFL